MTSIHRPCCSAMARASSARTIGLTSLRRAVRQRPGDVRALADDHAALGGRGQGRGVGARRDEDQLVEDRRRRFDLVAIDRPRVVASPRRRRGRRARRRSRRHRRARRPAGVSQIARRWTVRPPRRRSAEAATRTTVSRSSVAASPSPTARSRPLGRLAAGRERRRVALAGQLAERDERWPARRRPAGRARRAGRRRPARRRSGRRGRRRRRPTAGR